MQKNDVPKESGTEVKIELPPLPVIVGTFTITQSPSHKSLRGNDSYSRAIKWLICVYLLSLLSLIIEICLIIQISISGWTESKNTLSIVFTAIIAGVVLPICGCLLCYFHKQLRRVHDMKIHKRKSTHELMKIKHDKLKHQHVHQLTPHHTHPHHMQQHDKRGSVTHTNEVHAISIVPSPQVAIMATTIAAHNDVATATATTTTTSSLPTVRPITPIVDYDDDERERRHRIRDQRRHATQLSQTTFVAIAEQLQKSQQPLPQSVVSS
jgi:hypothetical protein